MRYIPSIRKPRKSALAKCFFCEGKTEPSLSDVESLKKFMTERGKITGKAFSGVCSQHQRGLTRIIKRARYLALLPYVAKPA